MFGNSLTVRVNLSLLEKRGVRGSIRVVGGGSKMPLYVLGFWGAVEWDVICCSSFWSSPPLVSFVDGEN